jgi:hypothetical protein
MAVVFETLTGVTPEVDVEIEERRVRFKHKAQCCSSAVEPTAKRMHIVCSLVWCKSLEVPRVRTSSPIWMEGLNNVLFVHSIITIGNNRLLDTTDT